MKIAWKVLSMGINALSLGLDVIQNQRSNEIEGDLKKMQKRMDTMEQTMNKLEAENAALRKREQAIKAVMNHQKGE